MNHYRHILREKQSDLQTCRTSQLKWTRLGPTQNQVVPSASLLIVPILKGVELTSVLRRFDTVKPLRGDAVRLTGGS